MANKKEDNKKNTKTTTKTTAKTTTKSTTPKKVVQKKKNEVEKEIIEAEEEKIESNPLKNTLSDRTRYLIVGITTILFLVLIVVLIVFGNNNEANNGASNKQQTEERNTSTETLKKFYQEFDSKDINVIFFESSGCSYCQLQAPIMKQIVEDYDMKYYDIDASKLTETEIEEIINALGISGATPTTVVVQDGKVLNINEGYLDGKPFVEFFVNAGVLKKGSTYKPEENLKEITYDKFKKIAKEDKYQLIYLDTSACPDCIEVRSILGKLAEENDFEVNYLSAANMTEDNVNALVDEDFKNMEYDDEDYLENQTIKIPLLLVVKDNKIKNYVLESTDESDYTKILEKYDFID